MGHEKYPDTQEGCVDFMIPKPAQKAVKDAYQFAITLQCINAAEDGSKSWDHGQSFLRVRAKDSVVRKQGSLDAGHDKLCTHRSCFCCVREGQCTRRDCSCGSPFFLESMNRRGAYVTSSVRPARPNHCLRKIMILLTPCFSFLRRS